MPKKYTDEQREQILAAARSYLEDQGINVDQLQVHAEENRKARRCFSKPLAEGVSSRFKTIPPGFEEFRPVGRHGGGLAPRCMARSRHSGWKQCNALAKSGFRVCIRHGARANGTKTPEGIARSAAHLDKGAGETREARKRRSEAAQESRRLEKLAGEHGVPMVPTMRGPRAGTSWQAYIRNREKRIARLLRDSRA